MSTMSTGTPVAMAQGSATLRNAARTPFDPCSGNALQGLAPEIRMFMSRSVPGPADRPLTVA